ncbi:hypothetical protein D0Z00_003737 [Geotrichum galactomycetum]|uniref:Uncharacterized protein n=1 Tax=Geotrichum galactomycetum TaxID=27317 RepID=A0ACB6V0F9_9ASCO|nr:hypothetical protein D0Z00_003737 [Geotrichum candidum]
MSGSSEGHWHPSKRPSRSDLLKASKSTTSDSADANPTPAPVAEAAATTSISAPLIIDKSPITLPAESTEPAFSLYTSVSKSVGVDGENSVFPLEATSALLPVTAPAAESAVATENSLSETLLETPEPALTLTADASNHDEEHTNDIEDKEIKNSDVNLEATESHTALPNAAENKPISLDVIDLTEDHIDFADEPIELSSPEFVNHKPPTSQSSFEELISEPVSVHTSNVPLADYQDTGVAAEATTIDNDCDDEKSLPTTEPSTAERDEHINLASRQNLSGSVHENQALVKSENPGSEACIIEEQTTEETGVELPIEEHSQPLVEDISQPTEPVSESQNLAHGETPAPVSEEPAETVFEKLSQSVTDQESEVDQEAVSKPSEPLHESFTPVSEDSEELDSEESEKPKPTHAPALENTLTHPVEPDPPVVDLDSRPLELFSRSKPEDDAEEDENIFAGDDANDSFFNDISQPQDNRNNHTISFESDTDDFFPQMKDNSTQHADEPLSVPKRSDKGDPFSKLFEKDEDDFLADLSAKKRGRSHKRDPSFFATSSADDPFFSNLGSQDNASDFTAGLGLNAIPESTVVEETEKPKEPAPKADLSKSLAFLLEDDDELLSDDYVEPARPKTAATTVPSQSSATEARQHTLLRQASFANAFPSVPSAQPQQSQPVKAVSTPSKATGNNAFDLPTDMVPKIVKRVGSFQNTQFPPHGYGMPSTNTSPRPALTNKKSFFEELPPIPKKPMSRKTSAISLQQPGHFPGMAPPVAPPTGYPTAAPPSTRMPFVPPKGHSRNSSGDSSPLQNPLSSPGSVSKLPAQVSRTSSPYNPYEPQVMPPSNPYAPQNETQPPLLPPQPPFSPQSQKQALYSPKLGPQAPPAAVPSEYSPRLGPQVPVVPPPSQQYAPQTSPYQSRANSSVGFHQQPSYAPPMQSTPPPVLQPAANLTMHGSFGDVPSNHVTKQNPYASTGNLSGVNPNLSPVSRNGSVGNVSNVLRQSPQRFPNKSNTNVYTPGSSETTPAFAPAAPVNNEALLRRQFPIFRWGSTGKAVCVIPSPIAFGGASTDIEIKVAPVNQIITSDPYLSKFPFGIVSSKGAQKNKKKDLEKWIEEYIGENEEKGKAPGSKTTRSSDRIALWKVLLALLKTGSSAAEPSKELTDSVRAILDPFVQAYDSGELDSFAPAVDIYQKGMGQLTARALGNNGGQSVKPDDVNRLVDYIKVGQREVALKYALDQRLWAHSLILASSLGPTQWLNTVSEFVREEVRPLPSQSARDLAFMYRVFSGAGADSVSEIIPGQPPFSAQSLSAGSELDASLSNWRSLISMLFSNTSPMNLETAKTLSTLLLKSGFIEGAHLCHVLLGTGIFGAPDGSFELFGSDASIGVGRDVDSILLSLALEYYKLSAEAASAVTSFSHLILYKLNLVSYLIDRGNVTEAQTLFDNATGIVKSNKTVSYSSGLYDYIDVLAQRLNLTPQDNSSSGWFSSKLGRPKFDKMLGHLDKSFSKFVSGDDDSGSKEQDGIFKRLAETPLVSRTQSVVDLPNHSYAASNIKANPYGPPLSVNTLANSPDSAPLRSQSAVGLNQVFSPQKTQPRPFSPYTPSRTYQEVASNTPSASDYPEAPGSSVSSISRPPSSVHEVSASSLPLRQGSANPYAAASTGSNPYAPSHDASSGNPYASSTKVSSGNPYAPSSHNSSPAAPSQPFDSPSRSFSRNNSFPSVAEQEEPANFSSNPYAPSNVNPLASTGGYNPYAPNPTGEQSSKPQEESKHEHSSSIGDLHVAPSFGNYNPYAAYGYNPDEPATPEAREEEHPNEVAEPPENEPKLAPEPYVSPEYGYSHNDDELNNSSRSFGHSYTPSESIISPMGVPAFGSQTFASPGKDYQHSTSNDNNYEEEEIEDLGFANNSFKKKEEPAPEAEKKVEKKVEEKPKKGWFSWMRKGDSDSPKPVQIKLGEEMSLVYDPVLKRYVNKNAPKEDLKPVAATPPPPPSSHSSMSQSTLSSPPSFNPSGASAGGPLFGGPPSSGSRPGSTGPPSSIASGPPSASDSARSSPAISVSGGLDDLLAAAPTAGRKPARRNARNRYVDVMAQQQQQ